MTISNQEASNILQALARLFRKTAPRPVDMEDAKAMAEDWAAVLNQYNVHFADVMSALRRMAGEARDCPELSELVSAARHIKRDRIDKDPEAQREIRDQIDAKIAALEARPLRAPLEEKARSEDQEVLRRIRERQELLAEEGEVVDEGA